MFGTVDGTGRLDIYNLNKSEFPISSQHAPSGPNATRPALNKLEWDVSGKFVAVGSVDGTTLVYDVGKLRDFGGGDSTNFINFIREVDSSTSTS